MKSRSKMFKVLLGLGLILLLTFTEVGRASAPALFFDDFEGNLSQWVGKGGAAHHGVIVEDPLRPGNHVLTFTALNSAGDIFGSEVSVTPGQKLFLRFEYLGIPTLGGNAGDLGGFIGFAEDTPGGHRWLAGTVLCCGAESDPLLDDGEWHTYIIEFDPFAGELIPSNNTIRVMLEDFDTSGGVAGDVYFDNITITVARPVIEVGIDIKPGSDPNTINPKGKGTIPVAILSTGDFDATTQVDKTSLTFGKTGDEDSLAFCTKSDEDVNFDGLLDIVCHFHTHLTAFQVGDTEGILKGMTVGGLPIEGRDSVRIKK